MLPTSIPRNNPERAVVVLTAYLPAKKKTFTIKRSVKAYGDPALTPYATRTHVPLSRSCKRTQSSRFLAVKSSNTSSRQRVGVTPTSKCCCGSTRSKRCGSHFSASPMTRSENRRERSRMMNERALNSEAPGNSTGLKIGIAGRGERSPSHAEARSTDRPHDGYINKSRSDRKREGGTD